MKLLLLVLSRLDYRNSVDLLDHILDKLQRSRRLISPSSDSTSVRCSLAASSDSHRVQFAVLLFMNSPQSQLVSPSQSGRSLPSVYHWFLSVPLYQCWLIFVFLKMSSVLKMQVVNNRLLGTLLPFASCSSIRSDLLDSLSFSFAC